MLKNKLLSAMGGAPANYIEDVFSTWLYTNNTYPSNLTITNGIDLAGEGGLVWMKNRNLIRSHNLYDTARGAYKQLRSDTTNAEIINASGYGLTAFNADGFSLGTDIDGENYGNVVSWTFRKQPKFFDVVTYTGDGTSSRSVAHALTSVPGMVIIKRTDSTGGWATLNRFSDIEYRVGSPGYSTPCGLNYTAPLLAANITTYASSSAFNVGQSLWGATETFNTNGATYVAYLFAHNAGGFGLSGEDNVISCGSYTGTGTDQSISLGFEPQWVMIKKSSGISDWAMFDNMRGAPVLGVADSFLKANGSNAEYNAEDWVEFYAEGFKVDSAQSSINGSGDTMIYIAIRRGPMKVPTDATKVFAPVAYTGTGATNIKTNPNFPPDLVFGHQRNAGGEDFPWFSRLTGTYALASNNTAVESDYSTFGVYNMNNVGYTLGTNTILNGSGSTYVNFVAQRAPGFFDEVCYTGNGINGTTQSHNLGVVPEMWIVKRRSTADSWVVGTSARGSNVVELNLADGEYDAGTAYFSNGSVYTAPTSSVIWFGSNARVNQNGGTFVAYLFATCAGVSKVGSYTGTATTLQINCGFTGGARFVLIKRTDSTGDWYVWDSARGIVSGNDSYLLLNSTAAEVTSTDYIDTYSVGFEITSTAPAAINASGGTYIFLAIA